MQTIVSIESELDIGQLTSSDKLGQIPTMMNEATRILKYLQKYYKYRLKLNLSKEKTLITSLEENRVKFLGYELLAALPRARPDNKGYKGLVGKFYPDKKKVIAKVDKICKEILELKSMRDDKTMAAQID